ncbi:immunoglobulin superfamily member 8 [Coregonus clupeaformis]|uniref:immunoglobulin superfamily member 8 n=1 Tax=Coregonus clupeaformis TaxID=59861 RepID=UPI001BE033E4|nr:immunoglobulin superfamily member 8 [Coregonus clupeaformis]
MVMMASWRWTAVLICLQWVFQYALCREVTLPSGPLYRVAGFPLSIPCAVSGYEGSRTQDFEWYLYREDSQGRQMGVISTRDPGFPYAPFQARVRSGDVRVERDSGDKARLVFQRLRADDQGRYECYTPSTDSKYQGNYSALVAVKVIPDTLLISYSRSLTGQPVPEGAEITLTCSAGVQSKQHTHLSITFGVRGGGSGTGSGSSSGTPREIIAIDKELGLTPGRGESYQKRYDDGEITLVKKSGDGGRDVYVMRVSAVAPEDSGAYFCEASQWILDPDGAWQKIAQRTLEIGNLTVQPLADSLTVTSTPRGEVTLQLGSPLTLTCEVSGLAPGGRSGLLVQWMRRGAVSSEDRALTGGGVEVEVARYGPDGVVSWGDDSSRGGRGGGGSMEKEVEGRYSLRLFSAHPADSGVYRCAVSVYAGRLNPGPSSAATITQRSEGVTVNLKTKEVKVSAVANLPRGPLLKRGDTITLLCNISVVTTGPAQVEVQWLQRAVLPAQEGGATTGGVVIEKGGDQPSVEEKGRVLASLTYEGLSRLYKNSSSEVSMDRVSPGTYRLRIFSAQDQGLFVCQAEVWGQDPHGGWYNTGARAQSETVRVYLYARAADLLLIPLVVGMSSALFVGVVIIATVTCCFMKRLARQRSPK